MTPPGALQAPAPVPATWKPQARALQVEQLLKPEMGVPKSWMLNNGIMWLINGNIVVNNGNIGCFHSHGGTPNGWFSSWKIPSRNG